MAARISDCPRRVAAADQRLSQPSVNGVVAVAGSRLDLVAIDDHPLVPGTRSGAVGCGRFGHGSHISSKGEPTGRGCVRPDGGSPAGTPGDIGMAAQRLPLMPRTASWLGSVRAGGDGRDWLLLCAY